MEQTAPQAPTAWPPRRVVTATLVVVLIAGAFWILINFRLVFFSLFTAIVLSTAVEPLIEFLARKGVSRSVSVVLITLLILLGLAALVLTIAPLVSQQWATITSLVSTWYHDLHEMLINSPSLLVRRLGIQMPSYLPMAPPSSAPAPAPTPAQGTEAPPGLAAQAVNTTAIVIRSLFTVLAVGLLSSIWSVEGERTIRMVLLAVPSTRRDSVRDFIGELKGKVGAYTRGLVILCAIIGVMQLIAYLIIGLPNALLLGIIAGILEAVPLVGPLLGAIPAFIVAAAFDPSKVIWVVVSTIIVQMLENNLIVPRVMDKAVGVNPVAGLLAFLAFGSLFGFTGALLAIPLAAMIQLILNRVLFKTTAPEATGPEGRDSISILRYEAQDLVQDVRKQVRDKDGELDESTDEMEDAMEAVIQDLDSILAQIETPADTQTGQPANGGKQP